MNQITRFPNFTLPSELQSFSIGFDSMFDQLRNQLETRTGLNTSYPPYNIIKLSDTTFRIEVAVAGFPPEDLSVLLEKDTLTITGNSSKSVDDKSPEYVHRGISNRAFKRVLTLAEHIEVTSATVEHGMLIINLERIIPEEKKPKVIPIKF